MRRSTRRTAVCDLALSRGSCISRQRKATLYSISTLRVTSEICTGPNTDGIQSRCTGGYLHIALFAWFSHCNSQMQHFYKSRHINFQVHIPLKPLVSLMSRFIARSARISADRQTDRQTDRWTDRTTTVTLTHALRVKNSHLLPYTAH